LNGPKAFDDWSAAFDADSKAQGITEAKVTLGAPIVKSISSDTAYLTYPSLYTYKLQRKSMRETGRVAFALVKEDSAWKIAAWTGPVPFLNQSNKKPDGAEGCRSVRHSPGRWYSRLYPTFCILALSPAPARRTRCTRAKGPPPFLRCSSSVLFLG